MTMMFNKKSSDNNNHTAVIMFGFYMNIVALIARYNHPLTSSNEKYLHARESLGVNTGMIKPKKERTASRRLKNPKEQMTFNDVKNIEDINPGDGVLRNTSNDLYSKHNNIFNSSTSEGFACFLNLLNDVDQIAERSNGRAASDIGGVIAVPYGCIHDLEKILTENLSQKTSVDTFGNYSVDVVESKSGNRFIAIDVAFPGTRLSVRLNVITADMFDDAMRDNEINPAQIVYSAIFPRDIRMVLYLPVPKDGYVHRKDEINDGNRRWS